jgi:hypothetical protein
MYYYYTKYEGDMEVGQEPAMGFSQNNFSLETQVSKFFIIAILMLPDKQLIETDLLKTGFLFEYTQVITKTLYCISNN